jgi:hypothetical protein
MRRGSGWRIDRIPGRPLRRTEEGRMALPLWLAKDGEHIVDVELTLTPAEAEQLHAALSYALDGPTPARRGA